MVSIMDTTNSSCVVITVGHTDGVDNACCTNSSCVVITVDHTDDVNNVCNRVGKKVWKGEEEVEGDALEHARFWELEQDAEQIVDVQGRFKGAIDFWRAVLKALSLIIEYIEEVYKLPLSLPPIFSARNHKSVYSLLFVTEAIAELLHNCCIQVVMCKSHTYAAHFQ